MRTEAEQHRLNLLRNLRCAWQAWDAAPTHDVNLRTDIQRRIGRVEAQLAEVGCGKAEFAEYCAAEDAAELERERLARERQYERTGVSQ